MHLSLSDINSFTQFFLLATYKFLVQAFDPMTPLSIQSSSIIRSSQISPLPGLKPLMFTLGQFECEYWLVTHGFHPCCGLSNLLLPVGQPQSFFPSSPGLLNEQLFQRNNFKLT